MPITRTIETIRPTQSEFGDMAYEVINCVHDIHHEFGRFFDEAVDKRDGLEAFAVHARRLLQHTTIKALHWANFTSKHVTFTTLR